MCYHNYTRHPGCGHLGESHTQPWTLCHTAEQRLSNLRGPVSPPLTSPLLISSSSMPPPKRHTRIFSLSKITRATSTITTKSTRRAVSDSTSYPRTSTSSSSSNSPALSPLTDHELEFARCKAPTRRTQIASGMPMDVCKECRKSIQDMRNMLERYEKTGSVLGTTAFERFLKGGGEDVGEVQLGVLGVLGGGGGYGSYDGGGDRRSEQEWYGGGL
ncbi:uncharacterized protein BDR25DRAFT_124120 [Lindgomyces ingoldianus]|uniref:Uncharacterized protein n=1 Tax=Lindgomyces ingoldianus TaxID=673940 RepID=A0ACB6R2R6_9PLEO|nr:uncharacterized protein BDR25DRAFT_124120 [Lindgomyces ingoldianus]KAF2473614.1 hypothetical protein BDR25DRAFT_124120 [Lindgomyces ingoldianus]